ncbi:Iron(3+)-hydroxamate-binding protein YxeB precursor [compost metagenome]
MHGVSLPFRTHLFTFENIEYFRFQKGAAEKLFAHVHTLITVIQGSGAGLVDGKRSRLVKGGCYMLPPESWFEITEAGIDGLVICLLSFRMERAAARAAVDSAEAEKLPQLFPLGRQLNVMPLGQWSAMLNELDKHRGNMEQLEGFRQHIRMQELIYYLFERNSLPAFPDDPRHAVSQTIEELHNDVAEEVSVRKLAEKANISVRQYTYWFKELTGQTPMNYVTELRINEAKKQMLSSNESLSTIARRAGFQDVYYFSRRFKQVVGLSPRHFVSKRRQKLRIVALYYSGILLAMGVKPVGANLTWWGGSKFLKELQTDVVDVGAPPSLEKIAELEPDLIIMNDGDSKAYDQYAKIAPSVVIPYDGRRSIYEEIRLVGNLVDNPYAAEQFMDHYERRAAAARAKLAEVGIVGKERAAAIIRIEGNGRRFSVFGDKYGRSGWAVYRGLQLSAPVRVRQLMDSGMQIEQNLPLGRLNEYTADADYLFVINEGEGIEHIVERDKWNRLEVVRLKNVFELDKPRFSYFDPISLEAQLELLTEMLLEQQKQQVSFYD